MFNMHMEGCDGGGQASTPIPARAKVPLFPEQKTWGAEQCRVFRNPCKAPVYRSQLNQLWLLASNRSSLASLPRLSHPDVY